MATRLWPARCLRTRWKVNGEVTAAERPSCWLGRRPIVSGMLMEKANPILTGILKCSVTRKLTHRFYISSNTRHPHHSSLPNSFAFLNSTAPLMQLNTQGSNTHRSIWNRLANTKLLTHRPGPQPTALILSETLR